jgi:thioredoxin 1
MTAGFSAGFNYFTASEITAMKFSRSPLILLFASMTALAHADTAAQVNAALTSRQPALIEFGAETCSQCKRMKVVLDGIARRYQGRAHVVQVNVNRDQAVTRQFRIMVIPTLVFFDAQGKEAGRSYGFMDEVTVARKLHDLGVR